MDTRKKVAVVFAFIMIAIIFVFSAYLVIKMEDEKNNKPDVASLTDAGTKLVSVNNYISTEAITEEATTEEPTTQQITTEATTEKVTEAPTTELATEEVVYEEDYISDDYGYSYEDTYDYSGYEEESSGEGEDDSYSEPEEYVEETNDYIPEDSNDGMSYYTSSWTTAYAWTGNTCADGRYPELGYTAASNDPNLCNKWVYIDGVGEFYIHDYCPNTGVIDIYMGDEESCWAYGSQVHDIYIIDR